MWIWQAVRLALVECSGTPVPSSMAGLHSRLAAISSYLLPIAAARKVTHPHRGPTEFCHDPRNAPEGAGRPIALWDLKEIQQCLTADALQPIKEIDFAAHTLQCEPPRIGVSAAADFAASSRILSRNDSALTLGVPCSLTMHEPRRGVWLQAIPLQKLARPHVARGQPVAATYEIEQPDSGQLCVLSTTGRGGYCLTAGTLCPANQERRADDPPEPLTGLQGEGGACRHQGRSNTG